MLQLLLNGLTLVLNPSVFFLIFLGVAGGIVIGALPGLTATMGVAILLPFTFTMDSIPALATLVGIYVGAIYGGSISAILLKTPGTPASAATVFDGYELVKKGQATKALSMSAIASFGGGIISTVMLITISPLLASFALKFSAPEYFMLAVFGLTIIASISAKNIIKGFLAGFLGLFIATVGMDPITSAARFTFGNIQFLNGLSIIPVLIGLFALSEAFLQLETYLENHKEKVVVKGSSYVSRKEILQTLPTIVKSALMGTFIGSIPGAGADIASFVSYNEAKRSSKHPERFGTGCLEGIAAPEAGNNGVTGGALVPLLSLGVPGDAVAAILLGAFIMQGVAPGPMMFIRNVDLVYSIFSAMLLGNVFMLLLGLFGIRFFSRIVDIPKAMITPIIIVLSMVGSYAINNSVFDIGVTVTFGIIGYLLLKAEVPQSPIVLALILGPMAECNLRKSLLLYEGSYRFLYTRPITIVFILLSLFSLYTSLRKKKSSVKADQM